MSEHEFLHYTYFEQKCWRTCLVTHTHFTGVESVLDDNCSIAVLSYKYQNAVCGGVAGNVPIC